MLNMINFSILCYEENMWSLLTQNWNPSSIYEIKSTVNNRLYKRTAKMAKEMDNLSSKKKNILRFCSRRETKKMAYSLHVKRRPIHAQTCTVISLCKNELPVASSNLKVPNMNIFVACFTTCWARLPTGSLLTQSRTGAVLRH